MNINPELQDDQQTLNKVYSYKDLLNFQSANMYSSFGKMKLSEKQSAPIYGFGTAGRQQQQKVFQSKELAKSNFVGKTSPGPAYNIRGSDTFIFKNNPEWVIGTQQRNTLNTGAKYDYYLRQDKDFYPNNADVNRRSQPPNVKIGLELRFQNDPRRQRGTPGPQYNPSFRYDQKNPPKFTFGQKREVAGQSPLVYMGSTPNLVGPGSYILKNVPKTSKIQNEPKYSIPKAKRFVNQNQNWSISHINQPQSNGVQYNSKKNSNPQFTIGKSTRDAKLGIFKNMMATKEVHLKIPMPKF